MKTNYTSHARYWDWDEYDNSEYYKCWCKMSDKYGKRVLSAMGAIGEAGAYMARNGYAVTVLDYTEQMIIEGKKRFGNINGLDFVQADIRNFELKNKDYDFCFISGQDINLLLSLEDIGDALRNIGNHLRYGGGLGLGVCYPFGESHSFSVPRIDPRVQRKDDVFIWKESKSNYDAETQIHNIHQIGHVEKNGVEIDRFEHSVTLRYYDRESLIDVIRQSGYRIVSEDCNNMFELEKI